MKPADVAPTWKAEAAVSRVLMCASMLTIHGFVSAREREKINRRVDVWLKRHGMQLQPSGIGGIGGAAARSVR